MTKRPTIIYRVSAFRTRPGGRREAFTTLRRRWDAAERLAAVLDERGYGPVSIQQGIVRDWGKPTR